MVHNCAVVGCCGSGYRKVEGSKITFHEFPQDPVLRRKWIIKIRRDTGKFFQIKKGITKICSLHFIEKDFRQFSFGRRLKPTAIPTIFPWTIAKSPRQNPLDKIRQRQSEIDLSQESSENVAEKLAKLDHSYDTDIDYKKGYFEILELNDKLNHKISELQGQIETANVTNITNPFSFSSLTSCAKADNKVNFYTGFPTVGILKAVYTFLDPGPNGENIQCNYNVTPAGTNQHSINSKQGRPRIVSPQDAFIITMLRLRQGLLEEHLADMFQVSTSTVNRIFITWINHMYIVFGNIPIWASKETVIRNMPKSFETKFPSTRLILDATEIRVESPRNLNTQSQIYSHYKGCTTFKGLIGIMPSGAVTFCSQLYSGNISDKELTWRSGLLQLPWDKGDSIMVDKGFLIEEFFSPLGVSVNIPPFLKGDSCSVPGQFTTPAAELTTSIASERIHVERAIEKIKRFHIFDRPLPISMMGSINQIWTVCALLINFQTPIISQE